MRAQPGAIVTGGASGIGAGVARGLAEAGWSVALVDLDKNRLEEVADRLVVGDGPPHQVYAVDVTDADAVAAMVASAASGFGGLEGVVNAAGVSLDGDLRIEDMEDEVFDRTISVNLKGTYLVCKHSLGYLGERGGSIVNMASTAIFFGNGSPAYAASKGGVAAFSRVVAHQGADRLIRCNCITPGAIDTPMLTQVVSKLGLSDLAHAPGTIPRLGQPTDIANVVRFLLSDEAAYITGATYAVDGGQSLH